MPGPVRRLGELVLPAMEADAQSLGGGSMSQEKALPQCPFYLEHNLQSIVCEGALPGSQLRTEFGKTMECSGHVAVFCTSEGLHPCCPIYGMLMEKYEKGGREWQSD